jgi:hypothetical protein
MPIRAACLSLNFIDALYFRTRDHVPLLRHHPQNWGYQRLLFKAPQGQIAIILDASPLPYLDRLAQSFVLVAVCALPSGYIILGDSHANRIQGKAPIADVSWCTLSMNQSSVAALLSYVY